VRGRALRPVDEAVLDDHLLGGMVSGGQAGDQRGHRVGADVELKEPRAVVGARCAAGALVGVAGEERAAVDASLEREPDRGPKWLEASAGLRRLEERTRGGRALAVEHEQV